jgi:uncharacterized membrane protein
MDAVHIHLFLNHVPLVGGIGALLFLAWGLLRRSTDVTLAALVAIVVVALIAIPAFITGRSTEVRAERFDVDAREFIEKHEEAALAGMIGIEATAAIALAALFVWRSTRRYPTFGAIAVLLVGILAAVLIVRAASLGGQIRHTEIRTEVHR